jgi:hypothetical protein
MPNVKGERFFRIQGGHSPWAVASERFFGNDFNEMANNWRRTSHEYPRIDASTKYANEMVADLYNWLVHVRDSGHQNVPLRNLLDSLHPQRQAIEDNLLALREYVFEDIRRQEFVDLPSRQKCLFLCPARSECVRYWWKILGTQGTDMHKKIWEVEVTGISFLASDLVKLQSMSVEEWEKLARQYWSTHEV